MKSIILSCRAPSNQSPTDNAEPPRLCPHVSQRHGRGAATDGDLADGTGGRNGRTVRADTDSGLRRDGRTAGERPTIDRFVPSHRRQTGGRRRPPLAGTMNMDCRGWRRAAEPPTEPRPAGDDQRRDLGHGRLKLRLGLPTVYRGVR